MKKNHLFYDIEAFEHYWCVVVVDEEIDTRHVFEDVESLRGYYKRNRKRTWIGYNSRQYDSVMLRFIMLGLDPYKCSQDLIVHGKKWFEFGFNVTEMYKRIPLRNFDCVLLNKGLKKLEGFRGSMIKESTISWDYDDILTREQKDEILDYCTHDVLEMRKVFYETIQEYDAHEALVSAFSLDDMHFSKSKAQLVALILNAQRRQFFDEWKFEIADTLQLDKYKHIHEWYLNLENHDYSKSLKIDVAGVPHVFAWGGIHGAKLKYAGEGFFLNMDVASYYPAMMIEYNYLSRTVEDSSIYRRIRDDRLVLKKNKDPKQLPYKIVLNSTYGAMKDRYNPLFDPRQANSVCVTGQLLLLDLIEKLEPYCDIIQSNTDGVLVKLRAEDIEEAKVQQELIESIGQEWSKRTRMELEYETVSKVFQKDVNNYLTVDEKGKVKSKGAWADTWLREDENKEWVPDYTKYDLVILRKALHRYFVDGVPVETTINESNDLQDFQKIVMVSRKYDCALHGELKKGDKVLDNFWGIALPERHLRVFASTNEENGMLFKLKNGKAVSKVSDMPKHVFIVNEDITGAKCTDYPLDKEFYIKMAQSRVRNFVG